MTKSWKSHRHREGLEVELARKWKANACGENWAIVFEL